MLQATLATCKVIAQRRKRLLSLSLASLVALLIIMLVVGHRPLKVVIADWIQASGLGRVQDTEAAYAAHAKGRHQVALRIARPLAEQGDARAQALLGEIYYHGLGAPRDDKEAVGWFKRAAEQGDATAQFHLGEMYSTGHGVPQDFSEAAKWYHLAADQKNATAQYNLGVLYANGEGVPQDNVLAHMWFNLAAAHFPPSTSRNRAIGNRDALARKMLPVEVSEAQQRARDWKPK